VQAVGWAQKYARTNREVMMQNLIAALRTVIAKPFETHVEAVNCHHNYVQKERHFGQDVLITRKGAVSARAGELGIIPGSMGAKSFIVRGKGNPESFNSCSHGAGRTMSRTRAKREFTLADQIKATEGVECRKDEAVIDEIPMAYKDIDAVMAAQRELVEVVHTLKQVVCVKG
jgi:tRNA-splicing ligase RtcB